MNIPGWSEDMMKSLTEAQQKYWANLMSMSGSAGGSSTGMPDWVEGMEKWWSLVTPQMPVQANELMGRVFEMGKVYTRLAEETVAAASGSENKNVLEGWMAAMEKGFKDWSVQGGAGFSNPGAGGHFFEGWQQLMDSMNMGAFIKDMPSVDKMLSASEAWQAQIQKMTGLSGLGGTISQDSQKKLAELAVSYQKAMQDYMSAFSGQGVDSVQALRERVAQLGREGGSITSLRELYDLWIDVSEEVYRKFVMSDHYQKVYGEMVNSFVALKGGIDTVREAQLQALHILTNADLDESPKSQHEAVRENEDLNEGKAKNKVAAEKPDAAKVVDTAPVSESVKPVAKEVSKTESKDAPENKRDDLTQIKGLGPKLQEKLIDAGIQTFDQLAALSDDQAQMLDKQLDARGRLVRENWVAQAATISGSKLV